MVDREGIEPNRLATQHIKATDLQSAVGNKDQICNTLFRMCVLKHSSWMNPLALRPENALIRYHFTHPS